MNTKYDFKLVEENKYDYWLKNDLFRSGKDLRKENMILKNLMMNGN